MLSYMCTVCLGNRKHVTPSAAPLSDPHTSQNKDTLYSQQRMNTIDTEAGVNCGRPCRFVLRKLYTYSHRSIESFNEAVCISKHISYKTGWSTNRNLSVHFSSLGTSSERACTGIRPDARRKDTKTSLTLVHVPIEPEMDTSLRPVRSITL
jgi:hypothetical protein